MSGRGCVFFVFLNQFMIEVELVDDVEKICSATMVSFKLVTEVVDIIESCDETQIEVDIYPKFHEPERWKILQRHVGSEYDEGNFIEVDIENEKERE